MSNGVDNLELEVLIDPTKQVDAFGVRTSNMVGKLISEVTLLQSKFNSLGVNKGSEILNLINKMEKGAKGLAQANELLAGKSTEQKLTAIIKKYGSYAQEVDKLKNELKELDKATGNRVKQLEAETKLKDKQLQQGLKALENLRKQDELESKLQTKTKVKQLEAENKLQEKQLQQGLQALENLRKQDELEGKSQNRNKTKQLEAENKLREKQLQQGLQALEVIRKQDELEAKSSSINKTKQLEAENKLREKQLQQGLQALENLRKQDELEAKSSSKNKVKQLEAETKLKDKQLQQGLQALENLRKQDLIKTKTLIEEKRARLELNGMERIKAKYGDDSIKRAQAELELKKKLLKYDTATGLKNQTQATSAKAKLLKEEVLLKEKLARATESQNKALERENSYNSVMSIHSAKRAIGYTALFAGISAVSGATYAMVDNFLKADLSMRTMGAVLDLTRGQAIQLSTTIRNLGEVYGGTLAEIDGVALALGRAGIATKDIVPATKIVLAMARLTGDTFETSANAIISFQQVFGNTTSIEKLGDKLAYIANVSRLSTHDIGTFSNYALASAQAVGLTEDAVGGLASAFSNAGVNASTIGTQIRTFTGILTENTEDVKQFFRGIGVSQEELADKLKQGGAVSNKAILDLIQTMSMLDGAEFNRLTGTMDKLTANVLNLMRNNKDNITKFTTELQDGVGAGLSATAQILESYTVTFEKFWNKLMNKSQQGVSYLERMMTDSSLKSQIESIEEMLDSGRGLYNRNKLTDTQIKQYQEELKQLKLVYEQRQLDARQLEISLALETAVGSKRVELIREQLALETKSAEVKKQLDAQEKAREAETRKLKEETYQLELQTISEEITARVEQGKSVDDLIKKLESLADANKKVQEISVASVQGSTYKDLASNIKSKFSDNITPSQELLNTYYSEVQRQIENNTKALDRYFTTKFKGTDKELAYFKDIISDENGLDKLRIVAIEKEARSLELKGQLENQNIKLTDEAKKAYKEEIEANKAFIFTYNKIAEIFGIRTELIKSVDDISDTVNKSLERKLQEQQKSVNNRLKVDLIKVEQDGIRLGKKDSDIKKEQLRIQENKKLLIQDENALQEHTLTIENLKLDIIKAESKERDAEVRKREQAGKSIYAELDAMKDQAILLKEITQFKDGTFNTTEGQILALELEVEYAKKNLDTSIKRGESEKDIAKFKRDSLKAEFDLLKAKEKLNKETLAQKQLEAKRKFDESMFFSGDTESEKSVDTINYNLEAIREQIIATSDQAEIQQLVNQYLDQELELRKAVVNVELEYLDTISQKKIADLERQNSLIQDQSNIYASMANIPSFGSEDGDRVLNSLKQMSSVAQSMLATQSEANKIDQDKIANTTKLAKVGKKYGKDSIEYAEAQNEFAYENSDILKRQSKLQEAQINNYAGMAGAVSAMFEQGSKEALAFQTIQSGLAMVNAVNGVLASMQGDPYTMVARVAVAIVTASSLLSNIGMTLSAINGGGTTTTSYDYVSGLQENMGTGSVLGDAEAQSESIVKSLGILEDYKKPEFETLQSMNRYLANISDNIGGVTSLLIQSGGFAFGEGFTPSAYSKQNVEIGDTTLANTIFGGISGLGISKLFDKDNMFSKVMDLLSGKTLANKILGGIFGKTKVSQTMTDSGIYFADQLLSNAIEAFEGSAYQTIQTVISKKSWFSKSTSISYASYFKSLDEETERQFSLVLSNLYNTVLEAGDALDANSATLEDKLKNFVVSIGKISLKGKTGDEIQEQLTAIFGKLGDDITKATFPLLTPFQKIGEGMFETLTRVAVGMEEAEYYIRRLGNAFSDLTYTDILNPQGDVGFEALLQSIIATDERINGLDNNLIEIIKTLDSTAEELYGAYLSLDLLRDTLKFLKLDVDGLSFASIRGAGSLEALAEGMNAYVENFLTEEEQLAFQTNLLIKEFNKMKLALPNGKEGFKDLIESLDLSTEAGQELYGRLITISEAFAEVADKYEDSIKQLEESFKGEFYDIIAGFDKVFASIQNNISKTQSLIDKLMGQTNNESSSLAYNLIEYNKAYADYMTTGSQESLDALLKYADQASTLGGNIPVIVEDLRKAMEDLKEDEDVIRVSIVDGLGDLLGLTESQLIQLKKVSKDGKVTNDELNSITDLTEEQKDGIKEFASKSQYISTEETLSSLNEYMRLQLDVLRESQARETEKLSAKTFEYGDYIGKQEQLDIARTLGVSYETAQPLIDQLQTLDVSTDPTADIEKMLGYTGAGDLDYDVNMASTLEKLSQYLPNYDIAGIIGNVQSGVSTNIETDIDKKRIEKAIQEAQAIYDKAYNTANSYFSAYASVPRMPNAGNYIQQGDFEEGIPSKMINDPMGHYFKRSGKIYWISKASEINSNYNAYLDNFNQAYSAYKSLEELQAEKALKGYASGGYTGDGGKFEPAGIVHRGEYVVNSETTKDLGLNQGQGGVFKEMLTELKTIKDENSDMKKLLIKLTADNNRMLTLERATFSQTQQA